MQLTPTQRDILRRLAEGEVLWSRHIGEAWMEHQEGRIERTNMDALWGMYEQGLVQESCHIYPVQYWITPAGRAALAAAEGGSK